MFLVKRDDRIARFPTTRYINELLADSLAQITNEKNAPSATFFVNSDWSGCFLKLIT